MAPRGGGPDAETRQRISDIKIEDIDFDVVAKCTDKHVLQRYIKLLNDDGAYFIDLLNATKKKLLEVAPKEYYLLYPKQATEQEVLDARQDLLEWEESVKETDTALKNSRKDRDQIFEDGSRVRAPIRGQEETIARPNLNKKPVEDSSASSRPTNSKDKFARDKTKMKDYYTAWDQYDVDKMEDEFDAEERAEEEAKRKHFEDMREEQDEAQTRTPIKIDSLEENIPEAHRKHLADSEKEKGNEAFYAKDYGEAEAYYSRSLHYCPGDHATWANRALVRLKLENNQGAVQDCDHSLAICPQYMKALHRKGKALYELKRYDEAVEYFQRALAESPGNSQINGDLMIARRQCRSTPAVGRKPSDPPRTTVEELPDDPPPGPQEPTPAGYTRVVIEEDSDSESEDGNVASASSAPASGRAGGGFRKVVIEEVSGSEDEAPAAQPASASTTPSATKSPTEAAPPPCDSAGFRKVAIVDDDSEDECPAPAAGKPSPGQGTFQPPPRVAETQATQAQDAVAFDDMD